MVIAMVVATETAKFVELSATVSAASATMLAEAVCAPVVSSAA